MARQTLDEILSEDSDLLDVKPVGNVASTEHQRVIDSFEEINRFIDRFRRKPGETVKPSVSERSLQIKLSGLRNDISLRSVLMPYDRHDLLSDNAPVIPQALDDILNDDDLLSTPQDEIFELVHVRPTTARPDEVAERQVCKEFENFKPLFEQCVRELSEGKRKAIPFANEQEIKAGEFFILNGVMVYVAEVGEMHVRNGKKNARLRLIFDNGTEGNNLLRSLATELYKDLNGRRVTSTNMGPLFEGRPQEGDTQTGMIYVVKSVSADPEIRKLDDRFHETGIDEIGSMELEGCWLIPRLRLAERGAVSWQDGVKRSRWR